jgi:hypothetical protein
VTREEHPSTTLRRLVSGYQVSQAIHVAATLGIADLLAEGARASDDLADATQTHRDSLYRLLRALASVGVLREKDGRRFELTPVGSGPSSTSAAAEARCSKRCLRSIPACTACSSTSPTS